MEFSIPIGMLPFLVISDTKNIDSAPCEIFVSNSCENTEKLKENDHREDTHVLKETVIEDDESHACKGDLDHIEDDEIKDHTSENEVGRNIYKDTETSFCIDSSEHRIVGEEPRDMETHHVNIEDFTMEITHRDYSYQNDNRDEEVEKAIVPYILIEDSSTYQYSDGHIIIQLSSECQPSKITHEQEMEKQDITKDSQNHSDDEASTPLNLKFISSLMFEQIHYNVEE